MKSSEMGTNHRRTLNGNNKYNNAYSNKPNERVYCEFSAQTTFGNL